MNPSRRGARRSRSSRDRANADSVHNREDDEQEGRSTVLLFDEGSRLAGCPAPSSPRVSGERIKGSGGELPVQGEGPSAGALGWEPGREQLLGSRVSSVSARVASTRGCCAGISPARTTTRTPPRPARISRHRALPDRHQQPGAHGALPTFTMIRLTGSAAGSTPQRLRLALAVSRRPPRPGRQAGRGASRRKSGRHRCCRRPLSARFRVVSEIEELLPPDRFRSAFGLASTHAAVWQCRPAVTSSGRFAPQRAIPRPVGPQLLRAAASARGRHHSRHG